MEEIFITEEELEYFTDIPTVLCEEAVPYKSKSQKSFEEEVKACNGITLEEFSKLLEEAINNDPRFT